MLFCVMLCYTIYCILCLCGKLADFSGFYLPTYVLDSGNKNYYA